MHVSELGQETSELVGYETEYAPARAWVGEIIAGLRWRGRRKHTDAPRVRL
jgi:hypothetical protein